MAYSFRVFDLIHFLAVSQVITPRDYFILLEELVVIANPMVSA